MIQVLTAARHSETLDWYDVVADGNGIRFLKNPGADDVRPVSDPAFVPTHVHYKGGLYRVLGHGIIEGEQDEMTLYCDGIGNGWIRPRGMFEDVLESGRPRFAPFSIPACA